MKKTIRLNENQLNRLVKNAVQQILKEEHDIDTDTYFGGGLPEPNPQSHRYSRQAEVEEICNKIAPFIDEIADIIGNSDCDDEMIENRMCRILDAIDTLPSLAKHLYTVEYDVQ